MSDNELTKETHTAVFIPPWVGIIILVLALIEPLSHLWVALAPPEGTVHSGLHTVDTHAYLSAMRYYGDDYFSPYASCTSPYGENDRSYYTLPHHHVYGFLGMLARLCHIPYFHFLGLANGLGLAFHLLAAYVLLGCAVPKLANRAFVLLALGGGAGGVLYVITAVLGLPEDPRFTSYFMRYFLYELNEGARFQPHLMMARMYYTVPLGLGYLGLAGLVTGVKRQHQTLITLAYVGLALSSFLNFRSGPMFGVIGLLCIACFDNTTLRYRLVHSVCLFLSLVSGAGLAALMASQNPELIAGATEQTRSAMWLSPFLSAAILPCLIAPLTLIRRTGQLSRGLRTFAFAVLAYVASYFVLYVLYHIYYGNFWVCMDVVVAHRMTDWALLGAVPGAVYGWRRSSTRDESSTGTPLWMALWFLVCFAIAISAFGQGFFIRFAPDRFIIVLGLPLAVLFADALTRLKDKWPELYKGLLATSITCGVTSIAVTWCFSYGPPGENTMQRSFPWTHWAFINEADARLLETMESGTVLTPAMGDPLFGDVLANRPGFRSVFGNGTVDYSRQIMPELRSRVFQFYEVGCAEAYRRSLVEEWCVDYLYCPDTTPLAPEVIAEFRALSWLEEVASENRAVLFKVH
jgi:hypothetical protein